MVGSAVSLLARAGREVQVADHLLTDVFPLVQDPKILLSAMRHGLHAMSCASEAAQDFPIMDELDDIRKRFSDILHSYDGSPAAFYRKQQFVIASDGFEQLQQIDLQSVVCGLALVKEFVYAAGKHAMVVNSD